MVELVIANNDDMALGAISAPCRPQVTIKRVQRLFRYSVLTRPTPLKPLLRAALWSVPLSRTPTVWQRLITSIAQNFLGDKEALDGLDSENLVGKWRVNIPYGTYTGDITMITFTAAGITGCCEQKQRGR